MLRSKAIRRFAPTLFAVEVLLSCRHCKDFWATYAKYNWEVSYIETKIFVCAAFTQESSLLVYEKISTGSAVDSKRIRRKCVLTVESLMKLAEDWRRLKIFGAICTVQCVFHRHGMQNIWCICNREGQQQLFTDCTTQIVMQTEYCELVPS